MDYSIVIAVDDGKLEQLELVIPTWVKNKPSLTQRPLICILDRHSTVSVHHLQHLLQDFNDHQIVLWPDLGVEYQGDETQKFYHPQRSKMLAGFVHVPARHVQTPYWLKLDLDVVALGMDDWIDPEWNGATMIAPGWSYTKPPDQMLWLDDWLYLCMDVDALQSVIPKWLNDTPPLRLIPEPGNEILQHKRICSWCAFFKTQFTKEVSALCEATVGKGQIPVPSQDGLMWYLATRGHLPIIKQNMKHRGWKLSASLRSIREAIQIAMEGTTPCSSNT